MSTGVNREGLTFEEWLAAAKVESTRGKKRHYLHAWRTGEDPCEWAAKPMVHTTKLRIKEPWQ